VVIELQDIAVSAGDHVVQFYERDSDLVQTVGRYLTDAARADAVAIVIATEAHRRAFEAHLEAAGIDLAQLRRSGRLVSLDAATTMAQFMPDGQLDPEAFHRVIGALVRESADTGSPVRAYGEMVALLWEAGDVMAAIELETLWNDLGRDVPFSLFCAYHAASISGSEHGDALQQVCHLHSSVLHAPVHSDADAGDRHSAGADVTRLFGAELDAPRAARHFVADALRRWGHGGRLVDDAQLVLTELATNAVIHAQSSFSVTVRGDDSIVRISVEDASPVAPTLRDGGPMAPSGRGLRLVAALASHWGVAITNDGKSVWAELHA
jgi:anti-sigma regulatory factor (Ser/Thr protein kinase)